MEYANAGKVSVYDYGTGKVAECQIVYVEEIDDYGTFFMVEHPSEYVVDAMAVILTDDGVQFTTDDWQGLQPQGADDIPEFRWVDACGAPAIMFDGLPRVLGVDHEMLSRIMSIDEPKRDE